MPPMYRYLEPEYEYAFRASARPPRRYVYLSLDNLAAILPYIEARTDLLAFMYTCKTLYRVGTPLLFGHPLVLDCANLTPFHRLLVDKGSECCLAIRDLDIRLDIMPDKLFGPHVALLTLVLRQARRLRRLRLFFELVERVPAVMKAVCSLTTLTTLEIIYDGDPRDLHLAAMEKMLASLQSPLAVYKVESSTAVEGCASEQLVPHWQADLLPSLARLSAVLEQVCLSHPTTTSLLAHDACYPRLTHLDVRLSHLPRLSTLAACFPQLQVLALSSPGLEAAGAAFLAARAANVRFQQERGPVGWHLTTLAGDAAALCALGLQCDAPTVRVRGVDAGLRGNWLLLGTTLKDLSPTDVSIGGFSQIPTEELPQVLGGLRWLTRLEITAAATPGRLYTLLYNMFDQLYILAFTVPSLWMFRLSLTWLNDPRLEVDTSVHAPFDPFSFARTAAGLAFNKQASLQVASVADDCYGMDSWWYRPDLYAEEFSAIGPELQEALTESYAESVYPSMVKLQREYCLLCCSTPCSCMFNWDG